MQQQLIMDILLHPEAVYMYEILDDPAVLKFTREVMIQSAEILLKAYPADFTFTDLENPY